MEELERREDGSHVHAADTVAGADEDADEAGLTPVAAPGVLDNPVLLASLLTVTDEEHSVVEVGHANVGVVNDAALVLEPGSVAGANTDRDRAHGVHCALKLLRVEVSHVPVVGQLSHVEARLVVAIVVAANEGVGSRVLDAIVPNVVKDPVREAASAALVLVLAISAVDNLLHREISGPLGHVKVSCLNCAYG